MALRRDDVVSGTRPRSAGASQAASSRARSLGTRTVSGFALRIWKKQDHSLVGALPYLEQHEAIRASMSIANDEYYSVVPAQIRLEVERT